MGRGPSADHHDPCVDTFVEAVRGEGAHQVLDRLLGYGCTGFADAVDYYAYGLTPFHVLEGV
jgi:hypothetical protein